MNYASQEVHNGQNTVITMGEEAPEPPIRRSSISVGIRSFVRPRSRSVLPRISPLLGQEQPEIVPRRLNLLTRIQHDPSMENLVALSNHLTKQRHKQHLQLPEVEPLPPSTFLQGTENVRPLAENGEPDQVIIQRQSQEEGEQEGKSTRNGEGEEEGNEEEEEEEEEDIYVEEKPHRKPRLVRTFSAPLLPLDSDSSDDDIDNEAGPNMDITNTNGQGGGGHSQAQEEKVLDLSISSSSSNNSGSISSESSDEPALAPDGSLVTRMRSHSTADIPHPQIFQDHGRVHTPFVHHGKSALAGEEDILETKSLEEANRLFDILIRHCRTKVRAPPKTQEVQFQTETEGMDRTSLDKLRSRPQLPFAIHREEEHIDHVLHDKAFVALKIFAHLTLFDKYFQDVVEEKTVMKMRTLHLHRHMLEGDEPHRILTAKFISFLSSNVIRLSQWKRYVKPKAHTLVNTYMKIPDPILDPYLVNVRLSSELRLPPSGLYYDVDVEEVCQIFTTDPTVGLAPAEVLRRKQNYGGNLLPKPKRPSVILMLLRQIFDFMVLILIAAAIVSGIMGDWEATVVLLAVVLFNVVLGFAQEFRAERAMAALMKMNVPFARVTRRGQVETINAEQLVPGDIVLLEEGDQVTADLRLAEEVDLHIIEALLTGESDPVEKSTATIFKRNIGVGDRRNMCFMGTLVTKGRGKGIVVATGKRTEIGKIQKNISQSKSKPSVLQKRLTILGFILVVIALVVCGIIAIVGIAWGKDWLIMVKVSVSIAVSAIPEGLVAILTIASAAGTQNMARKKAIVRRVNAVEGLGSVTVICSDKTGTLTEGKMKTSDIVVGNAQFVVNTSATSEFEGTIRPVIATPTDATGQEIPLSDGAEEEAPSILEEDVSPLLSKMLMAMALCNNATIQVATEKEDKNTKSKKGKKKKKFGKGKKKSENAYDFDRPSTSLDSDPAEELRTLDGANDYSLDTVVSEKEIELEALGDPTEVALQLAAHFVKLGKNDWIEKKNCEFLNEFAFDSDRKRMAVVYKVPKKHCPFNAEDIGQKIVAPEDVYDEVEQGEEKVDITAEETTMEGEVEETSSWVLAKGATESITSICSHMQTDEGTIVPLTPESAVALERKSLSMAARGLRVLAFAYKAISPEDVTEKIYNLEANEYESKIESIDFIESDLIFLGYAGLVDPPRVGVKESVAECRAAGIRVIMITGDHQKTAQSIGETLGLFPPEIASPEQQSQLVMKGDQVDELVATGKLGTLHPFPVVFARVSPENKMQIVETLQKRGEITAMVGDGVNDAASIRRADVGIAMGLSGTDLAKQAASVVLANDRFTTIVDAVREGRRTYDNIRKFIMYLLSCNFAEIFLILVCVVSNQPTPFTSMMILYANLIADTPPALALGFEPADRGIMRRLPRNPKGGVFSFFGWLVLATQSALMTGIALAAFLIALHVEKYELLHAQSYTWALLTSVQLMHSFHSRTNVLSIFMKNPFSNPLIIVGVMVSFAGVFGGIYIPGLNATLDLMPLGWWDWGKVAIAIAIHFVSMEVIKVIVMTKNRTHKQISKVRKTQERFYSEL